MPPRPTAFDVSFPKEETPTGSISLNSSSSLKRHSDSAGLEDLREAKRHQLLPVAYYQEDEPNSIIESPDLVLPGEDPFQREDADGGTQQKPFRILTNFSFFDLSHRNEMISLSVIDQDDSVNRECVGAGVVFPYIANEEDEGQEDDGEDDRFYVRLGGIVTYFFDYTEDRDPVWIETPYAWYILKYPSPQYTTYFQDFYGSRRIVQMVISTAKRFPGKSYEEFYARFTSMVDMFGRTYRGDHLFETIPEIQQALEDDKNLVQLREQPLLRRLLQQAGNNSLPAGVRRPHPKNRRPPPPIKSLSSADIDLAVLQPQNQIPTHVTPLIASLAQGMVSEELMVVGGRPPAKTKAEKESEMREAHNRLKNLLRKAKSRPGRPIVDVRTKEDFVGGSTRYLKSLKINEEMYRIGDFVIVPIGHVGGQKWSKKIPVDVEDVDPTDTVADYFWFAKILYGDADLKQFHVLWLEYSSHTVLQELGHPQELFYNDICDHVDFHNIIAKVNVLEVPDILTVRPEDYFVKFSFDPILATFTSINQTNRHRITSNRPPENCPICPMTEEKDEMKYDRQLKTKDGRIYGIAYGGNEYHYDDYVLYKAESGPARIGFITSINVSKRENREVQSSVDVLAVGRISLLPQNVFPEGELRDERHVYLTKQTETVRLQDLIRVCFVISFDTAKRMLKERLDLSPDHFYAKYQAPSLHVKSWDKMSRVSWNDVPVCDFCVGKVLDDRKRMKNFLRYARHHRLPTLDLFGGVAAFSAGLEQGSQCLEVTDVIEKSPSAAKTIIHNFPDVRVHNQCANVILRYTIKSREGHKVERPKQIFDEAQEVPELINDVKCIVAGFPCQSHSRLNMYRKADDIKSNLILNALSWVDYFRPDICYFENVPGFLGFSFDALQAGKHKVEGGTAMGGLKLLIRALGDMSYQVRFGLLQAGHYGTPQRRIRFFLIAAVDGHPLPDFPQPTHDFPGSKGLNIKLQGKGEIRLIRNASGTAPHPVVTIEDSISDLPRFDWKHPNLANLSLFGRREIHERQRTMPSLVCKDSSVNVHCGYHGTPGPDKDFDYHHEPRTGYQKIARNKITSDLQHFTRCFPKKSIERVVSIPLRANADYRDLRQDLQEWQTLNPLSATARNHYRPGLYGRLDKKACFPTTVTNMQPTAKQSRVLNPWCKRMVTVRELARSQGFPDDFVFKALNNNVVTMHRQIGNAVPIQVGVALGRELRLVLLEKWEKDRKNATVADS